MRFGSLSFFCTKAYFKGGSLLQAPFSTPPKDGGHDRVYLGVRTFELFLAPTLPAKKKERKIRLRCIPAPKVIWKNLNHASLRSMAVLVGRARTSGEVARKMKTKLLPPQSPLGFLCPRPPLLLSAPNQNRHATQARIMLCSRTVLARPQSPHLFPKALENLSC